MNVDKLRQVVESLTPQEFVMERYADEGPCGTVCCIAGHALLLDGAYLQKRVGYFGFYRADGNIIYSERKCSARIARTDR